MNIVATKEAERFFRYILRNHKDFSLFKGNIKSVGGYVRDELWDIESDDLDLIVNTSSDLRVDSESFSKLMHDTFNDSVTTPIQQRNYPIWKFSFRNDIFIDGEMFRVSGVEIDVANPQKESFPEENSRQRITEVGTLEEDAFRRDFTINTLMKDLTTGQFEDVTGFGLKDIKGGILRINPNVNWNKVFSDDPLRMLRMIRFFVTKTQLKSIEKRMIRTVRNNARRINIIAPERVLKELQKMMKSGGKSFAKGIRLMSVTGLLKYVLPFVDDMKGVWQNHFHKEGHVYKHILMVLENIKNNPDLIMAAILHDIGKAQTKETIDDVVHFYAHEEASADIARIVMKEMKFDNATINKVVKIIRNHMKPHNNLSNKAIRKFIRDVGDEVFDAVVDLAEADALGKLPQGNREDYEKIREKTDVIRNMPPPKKPILDGRVIMDLIGIDKGGPIVGEIGRFLMELEDEFSSQGKKLTIEYAESTVVEKFKFCIK